MATVTTQAAAGYASQPLKIVNEAVRERETFKYDPFLFSDFRYNDTGIPIPSSEIASCGDSVLTGLAQLGVYQTGAERGFISLFDANYQYIVAEAVPGMPLTPSSSGHLVLCGVAIPRAHGTCEHVLFMTNTDSRNDQDLPLSLIPNLATDPNFNTKPYCQFGDGGQFYAAVPIRTHRGINIGAYCVMSEKQPASWGDAAVSRMRDLSRAIMGHLEANRSKNIQNANERLNRGLRHFLAGDDSITDWHGDSDAAKHDSIFTTGAALRAHQHRPKKSMDAHERASRRMNGASRSRSSSPQRPIATTRRTLRRDSTADGSSQNDSRGSRRGSRPSIKETKQPSARSITSKKSQSNATKTFSRAADIMREAFDVEGCLFFDVSLGSQRRPSLQRAQKQDAGGNVQSATSSSDDRLTDSLQQDPNEACELIGFSTTDASSVHIGTTLEGEMGMVSKRTLAKLVRRYPSGKIFNFDIDGELQSSDSSDDSEALPSPDSADNEENNGITRERKRRRTLKEGTRIHQAFPNARSVAFIPVWDLKRDRWFAAGFMYTCNPARVFTVDEELNFLKAFSELAASDVLNKETIQADQAKSDALGALSHELRSPLHGVLLGTELLNDTDLDVFQGNLTHTIETCCCTLLDTIDHLLDYSKINSFAVKQKRPSKNLPGTRNGERPDQFGKKQLFSDVNLDELVEEVADSMFAGYSFQHLKTSQLTALDDLMHTGSSTRSRRRLSSAQVISTKSSSEKLTSEPGKLSVYLAIDSSCSWTFHLQPGAIRRVVMNLLGNALKYTSAGNVFVTLTQDDTGTRHAKGEKIVKLVVQDTGKGINEEFLKHKLFQPFSQEDDLLPGTGLGLSLVKTIVTSLGGNITAKSEVGSGSTFTVTLPLEASLASKSERGDNLKSPSKLLRSQTKDLEGLRVRVFGFETQYLGDDGPSGRAIVEAMCRDWLSLDLHVPGGPLGMAPDLVLWSDEALPEMSEQFTLLGKAPNIIVCRDSQAARRLSTEYDAAGYQGVFEFVSQPVGPRKLARSMQLAYKRWSGLTQPVAQPAPVARIPSTNSDLLTPGPVLSHPSPLEELSSLSLDPRLTPRNDGPDIRTSYFPIATSIPEEPPQTRTYTNADTFLLVDDNIVNLKVLSAYMSKLKLTYITASNGQEAVDAYTEAPTKFTAILMDLSMPVMDGLEATRQIRAHERKNRLQRVSILALTGLASDRTHKEAFESGVDVFLTKPVRLNTLRQELGLVP